MNKIYKITTILIAFLVAIVFTYIITNSMTSTEINSQVDGPQIELLDLNESPFTIHFNEKPTVLLFFTSWCPYCNEDAPKMVELYEKYKDEVNVYGINLIYQDDILDVKNYIDEHQIQYPILLDKTGEHYKIYGDFGFPVLHFIGQKGNTIDSIIGSTDIEYIEESFKYLIKNS
ncbi:TlpA family protein disulfide reductase [Chengkuizengella sediminis]|uniref:TlpA family protein disulfide reductase n=1 Tax=Chengkuizengella sediminis TaxID=1885917 RepID=UPI0013896D84|nr:TlpA disulfide reductase family protein [Chengkuizengella sediminis]NDI35074.1 TlpA family protein disulfide reductase [Chengkuizengella sediminis]